MAFQRSHIRIIQAPSILGLRSAGVERLGETLLHNGLAEKLHVKHPAVQVPTLNDRYSSHRDPVTHCLNPQLIRDFSLTLSPVITGAVKEKHFPLVLGGDCSILLGIMAGLRSTGRHGLIFIDAHADFYSPETSVTGEAADMDLALVTGHGPELLTNINGLRPYVAEDQVVHIGQRDEEETISYKSPDIRNTAIHRFDLAEITNSGIDAVTSRVLELVDTIAAGGYWIHFDTDVLADDLNPAVDYRLPGGLRYEQVEYLVKELLRSGKMTGMSVTIFNPNLDPGGKIAAALAQSIGKMFSL